MTQTLLTQPQPTIASLAPKGPYLVLDRDAFLPCFNVRACSVRHRLSDHPLLALPRLLELAQQLPSKYVRINSGKASHGYSPARDFLKYQGFRLWNGLASCLPRRRRASTH